MKRISTATRVLNKFGAGKDGYTDGDVIGGVPATDLEAALFDNVQEEIASVIEAAGIALNGAAYNQLLLALRAAGVFTTPAQFDNTTKAATTAFMKAAGFQFAGQQIISSTSTLNAANVGKRNTVTTNGITLTLPLANSVPDGTPITLASNGSGVGFTVARQGGDTIQPSLASHFVGPSSSATFVSDGAGQWLRFADESNAGFNLRNAALLASPGYQKLPSGLLVQWGAGNATTGTSFTFPLAFPGAVYSIMVANGSNGVAANATTDVTGVGLAGFLVSCFNAATGAATTRSVQYIAIGA